jgi:transcriptional regulator with XRE-family HTH domain
MKLKEWRENAGLTKKQLADTVGRMLGREITANHVAAWERDSMPGWDSGEAISTLTGGAVKPDSFVKHA